MRLTRTLPRLLDQAAADLAGASTTTYALPSGSDVEAVRAAGPVAAAAFGINLDSVRVDRATAMTIPAVRRGRQVICGTIGALPLRATRTYAGVTADVSDRPLLRQPDPDVTRSYLLTWLVDDLLFHGRAWWGVKATDSAGYPAAVERLANERIHVDPKLGYVSVDGIRVDDPRKLIRFDGPDEGVLTYGGPTLRTCLALEAAVRKYARLDVPLGVLELVEGAAELPREDVEALLDDWEAARAARTTAYLNGAVRYRPVQFDAEKTQLAEARQHQAAEVARLLNLPPHYVNAPNASGMTYSNQTDQRRDLVDTSLVGYLAAIADRLSMPDVTPQGTTVQLDTTALLRGDLLTALQAAQLAVELGAMTDREVRTDVIGRAPLPTRPTPAAPERNTP